MMTIIDIGLLTAESALREKVKNVNKYFVFNQILKINFLDLFYWQFS